MPIRLMIMALAVTLTGCATPSRYVGDESSPFFLVPEGTRVVLNRPVTVPPNEAGVFIQNGETRGRGEMRFMEPYCRLELRSVSNSARTVMPDEMVVARSSQHSLKARSTAVESGQQYAAAPLHLTQDLGDRDDGPTFQTFATRMELRSEKQPDLFRLTCGRFGVRGHDHHVTIEEMRRTLGDIITLHLPARTA